MKTRWFFTFAAIDPRNPDGFWEVGVPEWLYRRHQNNGNEKALARLIQVQKVLEETAELRKGWSRPGKDDCYVYLGYPKRDNLSLKIDAPAPPGMAFLVFVLGDGTIDDWTWRRLSDEDKEENQPAGVKGELLWPLHKTSKPS